MNYDTFITVAFAQGLNPEPLRVVQSWVEKEMSDWHNDHVEIIPDWDLGFAELGKIQTVEQAWAKLKHFDRMWQSEGTRQYKKRLGNPDPEGKGFYRYVLKTYYLCQ
jgi:hypothetical protein